VILEADFVVVVVLGAEVVLEVVWAVVVWVFVVWVAVVWIVEGFEVEEAVMISIMEVVGVFDVDFVQDTFVIWTIDVVEVVADSILESESVVSFSGLVLDVLVEVAVGSVNVNLVLLEISSDLVEVVVAAFAVLVENSAAAASVAHPKFKSTVL